jgi:hypothetical protein
MFHHSSTDFPFLPPLYQHKYTAAAHRKLDGKKLSGILNSTVANWKLCLNFINWHSSVNID